MGEFKRYWDEELKIGVAVRYRKIDHFFYKRPFASDCETVTYLHPITLYGSYGLAYHSGHKGVHISDYRGSQHIVDISGQMEVTIASNYSICEETPDYKEFYHKNMMSFYSPETKLMPLIGYVVFKEKITDPLHSMYEMRNNIEVTGKAIECDPNLSGDCLGQMAMVMTMGNAVHNTICATPFKSLFYNRLLSCVRLEGGSDETVLVRIKDIKPIVPCAYDLATKWRVPSSDISLDKYGPTMIHLISDNEIAEINTIGYIAKFSGGKSNCIYSYEMSDEIKGHSVAGWNAIVRKD